MEIESEEALMCVKRDLVSVKRDLVGVKRDLVPPRKQGRRRP